MLSIAVTHPTRSRTRPPRALLSAMKDAVLGRNYELSVAFIAPSEMKRLNSKLRGKPSPTDILSFPLSEDSGEILFCAEEVRKQALLFKRAPKNFLLFLFIHGLLHLKGYAHGSRMNAQENKFRKKFGI